MEQQKQQINQGMYQRFPYFNESNPIENDSRDGWYGSRPYGYPPFYGYGYPYGYNAGWGNHGWDGHHNGWNGNHGWDGHHNGWDGHHGWHRDDENNQRNNYGCGYPGCGKQPMPMPMPKQPIIQPIEKNYSEFKSLEQNVNITEINNTIIEIEQKHPYMMKRLLMMGIAYEECKKLIYLALLCSGKFDL